MPSRIEPDALEARLPKPLKPLSTFIKLAPKVSLYEPPQWNIISIAPNHPTTILICSWMNALPKHIAYYTTFYTRLFPRSRIILVTINTTEFLFHSEPRRRADMRTAVSLICSAPSSDRLFIHSLSNGGAKRVYGIAGAYRTLIGRALPVKAWLIDSAPGIPQFGRDIHALLVPARAFSWFVWIPYVAVALSITSVVYVVVNWMPKWLWRELVWGPMEGVNDVRLVSAECVKGFVYSKEDLAIDWRNVEAHVETAREKGWRVEMKRVEGAGHVQLFKGTEGEKGYWGFVERILGLGLGTKEP